MGSNTNDGMRNFAFLEAFKIDALEVCIALYKESGRPLNDEALEFVANDIDDLARRFEIIKNYDLDSYEFEDEAGIVGRYLKHEDVEKVFYDFRERLTTLILQLVLFNLEMYLVQKRGNDDD